jgi:hypothetical protein
METSTDAADKAALELDMDHDVDEALLLEDLRRLGPDEAKSVRAAGSVSAEEAARLLQQMLPDSDIYDRVHRCEWVLESFIRDGLPDGGDFRGDEMHTPLQAAGIPTSIVDALSLSAADISNILRLSTELNSAPACVAPIYVELGRNSEATLNALL